MTNRPVGVLVMSYGTPKSMDHIEAYYTHIRRGHPPTPEQLAVAEAAVEELLRVEGDPADRDAENPRPEHA